MIEIVSQPMVYMPLIMDFVLVFKGRKIRLTMD
jgi:hypothetical protein